MIWIPYKCFELYIVMDGGEPPRSIIQNELISMENASWYSPNPGKDE